jgi:hypothetical protein
VTITFSALSQAGRLGNQLWQIAATLGIAQTRNENVSFPPWDYEPYFNVPQALFNDKGGTDVTTFVDHLDPRARPYLQDYRLIRNVEHIVRQYFTPSPQAAEMLNAPTFDWYRSLPSPKTALHVRRGDNVTHPPGYHPLRSIEYYRRALKEIPDTASVVVFSDDIPWCRANLWSVLDVEHVRFYQGVARPREYVDRQKYLDAPVLDWIDLFLMAEADHHIISNSTYAWWGAFLSDDRAPIYPSNWFGWRLNSYTDASLMFPPSWRQIPDETQGGLHRC